MNKEVQNLVENVSALYNWLKSHRFREMLSVTPEQICNNFMQSRRRTPRNICTDLGVEAKRALTATLKNGLEPLRKSMILCLNEGDSNYLQAYSKALEEVAIDYFAFELKSLYKIDDQAQILSVSISRNQVSREKFELRALRNSGESAIGAIKISRTGELATELAAHEFETGLATIESHA